MDGPAGGRPAHRMRELAVCALSSIERIGVAVFQSLRPFILHFSPPPCTIQILRLRRLVDGAGRPLRPSVEPGNFIVRPRTPKWIAGASRACRMSSAPSSPGGTKCSAIPIISSGANWRAAGGATAHGRRKLTDDGARPLPHGGRGREARAGDDQRMRRSLSMPRSFMM